MKDQPADTADTTVTDSLGRRPKSDVTPFEAKLAWEIMDNPTGPKIVEHFAAQGRRLDVQTLYRWKTDEWRRLDATFGDEVADLVLATGLNSTMKQREIDAKLNGLLRIMTDAKMLRTNYRAIMAASIKGALAIARNSDELARKSPQAMGSAIKSASESIPKAIEGMQKMELIDQKFTQQRGVIIEGEATETADDGGPDFSDEIAAYSREAQSLQ